MLKGKNRTVMMLLRRSSLLLSLFFAIPIPFLSRRHPPRSEVHPKLPRIDVQVSATQVCIALPLDHRHVPPAVRDGVSGTSASAAPAPRPPQQQVFAFLPLRSYGLRMVVQGDFVVPSSREALDCDSPWNQELRAEIPSLMTR